MSGLDLETIGKLLAQDKQQTRTPRQKKDVTEPREYATWWRLRTRIREEGCENPNCNDPRPGTDKGTNIVYQIKGKYM